MAKGSCAYDSRGAAVSTVQITRELTEERELKEERERWRAGRVVLAERVGTLAVQMARESPARARTVAEIVADAMALADLGERVARTDAAPEHAPIAQRILDRYGAWLVQRYDPLGMAWGAKFQDYCGSPSRTIFVA